MLGSPAEIDTQTYMVALALTIFPFVLLFAALMTLLKCRSSNFLRWTFVAVLGITALLGIWGPIDDWQCGLAITTDPYPDRLCISIFGVPVVSTLLNIAYLITVFISAAVKRLRGT